MGISFVTFSLSLFVLTISYLLYFYFRGCPVELALVPPVDKLGDPVEITYDGVNEIADVQSEEIADKIVQDAITPDPGEKPSLVSRFFGIFKRKSKEPEKDIQEPELELVASIEQTEEIINEPVVPVETVEEVVEEPTSEEIEDANEEPATIKDKIVD